MAVNNERLDRLIVRLSEEFIESRSKERTIGLHNHDDPEVLEYLRRGMAGLP